jgi:Asp-tRNA(Asn)/Glu-tRNA(Gln) amidotransferase A subunit family amidase
MEELTALSASRLAALVRAREVSAAEVVQAHLARIERVDPRINAVVTRMADAALDGARAVDRAVAARAPLGPLAGVPFSINDAFDTAGVRTTAGSRIAETRVPARDAIAVERLRAAGALPLGKTNLSELGLNYDCANPLFGATRNPFDPTRTPGGSCGGEAAALAARLTPLGLGKDAAGSVRVPAHFCGVFGLMPTPGRTPLPGLFPDAIRQYVVTGVLARCTDDLELGLRALSGLDARDPASVDAPLGDSRALELRGLRVALGDPGNGPTAGAIRQRVEAAGRALEAAGAHVEHADPPQRDLVQQTFWPILMLEGAYYADSTIPADRWDDMDPEWRERREFMRGISLEARAFVEARFRRMHLQAEGHQWQEFYPILIAPAFATAAFPIGARELDVDGAKLPMMQGGTACSWANFMAVPAAVVPAGLGPGGLPLGVQVIGRSFRDPEVLAVARCLEQALGGCPVPEL